MYNKDNFFTETKATFKGCKKPKRKPDYISYNRDGQISSMYWYTDEYVIRGSNHWSWINGFNSFNTIECGSIASCHWSLTDYRDNGTIKYGKCYFKHFKGNK